MDIFEKDTAMGSDPDIEERREVERFKVLQGVYAIFEPYASKRDQVIDISEKGIAFQYIATKKRTSVEGRIAIFVSDNGFSLKDIPISIVSDIELKKMSFFSGTKMRRCGGRFGKLTPAQAAKLDFFMKNYIVMDK
jgi:hypothetical protein